MASSSAERRDNSSTRAVNVSILGGLRQHQRDQIIPGKGGEHLGIPPKVVSRDSNNRNARPVSSESAVGAETLPGASTAIGGSSVWMIGAAMTWAPISPASGTPDSMPDPVGQGGALDRDAFARQDRRLTIKQQPVEVFADHDIGDQTRTRPTLFDWQIGHRRLHPRSSFRRPKEAEHADQPGVLRHWSRMVNLLREALGRMASASSLLRTDSR